MQGVYVVPRDGPLLKPHIDAWEPNQSHPGTLADFHEQYIRLADLLGNETSTYGAHTEFAFTGIWKEDTEGENGGQAKCRFKIVPKTHETPADRLKFTCDVDSAIIFILRGQKHPVPSRAAMFWHVLGNAPMTLVSNLHLPDYVFAPHGEDRESVYLPWHKIPNAYVAELGGGSVPRIKVRLFFPMKALLREARDGNTINKEHMALLYDCGVRLVVEDLYGDNDGRIQHWPMTAESEAWRAQRENGQMVHSTRSIQGNDVNNFFEGLHDHCDTKNQLKWARGFVVQYEMQNGKENTVHDMPDPFIHRPPEDHPAATQGPDDPEVAFEAEAHEEFEAMRTLNLEKSISPLSFRAVCKYNADLAFFDISTNILSTEPGMSLVPTVDNHSALLTQLTGMDFLDMDSLVERGANGGYYRDLYMFIHSLGGFRVEMLKGKSKAHWNQEHIIGPYGVFYVQVYLTDKYHFALKDDGEYGKHADPVKMYTEYPNWYKNYLERLMKVLRRLQNSDQPVATRMETRLRVASVAAHHRWFDPKVIASSVTAIPTKDLMQFRIDRMESAMVALGKVFTNRALISERRLASVVTLGLGICFVVNSLLTRPQEKALFKMLADTLSVHKELHEVVTPTQDHGAFMFHSMKTDPEFPVPHVSSHRLLPMAQIAEMLDVFGASSGNLVLQMVRGQPLRGSKKRQRTDMAWGEDPASDQEFYPSEEQYDDLEHVPYHRSKRAKQWETSVVLRNNIEDALGALAVGLPQGNHGDEAPSADEDEEQAEGPDPLSDQLNAILNAMPGEFLKAAPKSNDTRIKDDGKWCLLGSAECDKLRWSDLKDSTKLGRWLEGWYQISEEDKFEKAINKVCPRWEDCIGSNGKLKKIQSLSRLASYKKWLMFIENEAGVYTEQQIKDTINKVRDLLREQAQWLPYPGPDRLWGKTGAGKNPKLFGRKIAEPVPVVVLNPRFVDKLSLLGGHC
ncbi:hypothetical protein FRC06_011721 [Ceratobasidium sp. 370]|nr:hypothetical protein FRC06_011721 [Ceratobasidium sp. 370]